MVHSSVSTGHRPEPLGAGQSHDSILDSSCGRPPTNTCRASLSACDVECLGLLADSAFEGPLGVRVGESAGFDGGDDVLGDGIREERVRSYWRKERVGVTGDEGTM